MTAAERSELAEFRQEMNARFDSLDDRLRPVETAVAVHEAIAARDVAALKVSVDQKFANTISTRERFIGKTSIAVALLLGLINILIHFL